MLIAAEERDTHVRCMSLGANADTCQLNGCVKSVSRLRTTVSLVLSTTRKQCNCQVRFHPGASASDRHCGSRMCGSRRNCDLLVLFAWLAWIQCNSPDKVSVLVEVVVFPIDIRVCHKNDPCIFLSNMSVRCITVAVLVLLFLPIVGILCLQLLCGSLDTGPSRTTIVVRTLHFCLRTGERGWVVLENFFAKLLQRRGRRSSGGRRCDR